jgi:PKD domain-containing protein
MTPRAASRALALVLAIVLALFLPARSPAQYMYLDTDGDGVRTAADVVSTSGPTNVAVWLRTNANRDGSPAVCSTGDGDLTISSYEVILSAHNGAVSWDALTNAMAQFSNDQGTVASGSDAHVAFAGSVLPPGTYHLATVRVSVTAGTPSIEILTSTGLSPNFTTSFSSACSGLDFDNALKLGSDWFDKDGVPYGGAANQNPVMGPVADMSVAEGAVAEQTIHATDPEGAPLTFVKISGPGYMSVSTITTGPPDASGTIRLEPDFFSAGTAQGVVGASDGFVATSATFGITVQGTPRPPILGYVAPMTDVADGIPVTQIITADDPDQEASQIRFSIPSGPPWVTALTRSPQTSFRAEGAIVVNPGFGTPAGVYNAIVIASKSTGIDSAAFQIAVGNSGGNSGPLILGMPDVGVSAGGTLRQGFTVFDVDADPILLTKDSGPPYMSVENTGQTGTTTDGLVTLTPGLADVGGAIGIIGASDGVLHSEARFSILVVDPAQTFATQLSMRGDPGDYVTGGQTFLYDPVGSTFIGRVGTWGDVNLSLAGPGGPGDFWRLAFMPPDSQILSLGFYANARRDGGFLGTPGLDISGQGRGCNQLTGHFEIKQLDVGSDGALRAFWARFEQHCENAVPGLTGEIRINANTELAVSAPLHGSALVGGVATFPISAVSVTGSPVTLRIVPPAPEGAEFIDYGNGTGEFTWRPLAPLAPTLLAFEARDAEGHVDRSTMLLSASERTVTSLLMFSDPGDPVGFGLDLTFGENEVQPNLYPWEPNRIAFQAFGTGGPGYYSLIFRAADQGRIVPGVYEGATGETYHTPGTPTLEIGPGYSPCGPVTGRFEVIEATYDDLGMLVSFDAYFSQNCGSNEALAITGEIRWKAHPAIEVDVPLSRAVHEGELSTITAVAPPELHVSYSIDGLPLGATFSDLGDNTARLSWTPDITSAGVYRPRLLASRSDGATESIPLRWNVLDLNRPPVADAGGPYEGVVGQPVEFDGSGSSDPDGDPIYFYWDFGDSTGASSSEMRPFHTYTAPGEYTVALVVYEWTFQQFGVDSTTASIHSNSPARLFVSRGNREIRLSSGKPAWCAQLEPVHSSFNASDVVLSSLVLVSDSTSGPVSRISAIPGKPSTVADTDGNGIEEVTACFAKQDLQQLFAYVSGKSVERLVVEGLLANGNRIRAVMQVEVTGAAGKAALFATPNPMNPETMLTYWLPRGSKVQLRIFDVAGRLVTTLADGAAPPGYGSVRWKPDRVASGIYYASLVTETERRTLRLMVLK